MWKYKKIKLQKPDKFLIIGLSLGLVFCLYGIQWGWVETWHPDQMALRSLFHEGKLPLNPNYFAKPPFHTYLNLLLSRAPVYIVGTIFLDLPRDSLRPIELIWSRMLTVLMFLGAIILVFCITKRFFGLFAARIISVIFATSAGFIAFSHFLTADIPMLFWMLLAFYFIQNVLFGGKISDYILAGVFTGVATATKYNGLAIGVSIVVAHGLSLGLFSWKQMLFNKKLIVGLSMIPLGFLICNPFALLDYPTFITHFMYNYAVAPVYTGITTGHGYWIFFLQFIELIGLPSFFVFSVAFLFSLYSICFIKGNSVERKGLIVILSVFLLYYYKFGSFPRLPARFVMPIVPLYLIMSGPFWNKIKSYHIVVSGILFIIFSYNLYASFLVGKRFMGDPRTEAQKWVQRNIPNGSSIENSLFAPNWNYIEGIDLELVGMPYINGRNKLFADILAANPLVKQISETNIRNEAKAEQWYSSEQLLKRQPDYIAIDSLYYSRFIDDESLIANYYPTMGRFFIDLLNEKYPYKIVFDKETKVTPIWIYPREIDFLANRMTILKKIK